MAELEIRMTIVYSTTRRRPQMKYGEQEGLRRPMPTDCTSENRYGMTIRCSEGKSKTLVFRCGQCEGCTMAWATKVKDTILDGIEANGEADFKFVTLTMCSGNRLDKGYMCHHCKNHISRHYDRQDAGAIIHCWRELRRSTAYRNRYTGNAPFFRVLEQHADGAWHIHLLIKDKKLPLIDKAKHNESTSKFYNRQSDEGKAFINLIRDKGFGTISDIQTLKKGRGGAAKYLSKYLNKATGKVRNAAVNRAGRRVRIYDTSKGWRTPRMHDKHQWAEIRLDLTQPEQTGCLHESRLPDTEKAVMKEDANLVRVELDTPWNLQMLERLSELDKWRDLYHQSKNRRLKDDYNERPSARALTPGRANADKIDDEAKDTITYTMRDIARRLMRQNEWIPVGIGLMVCAYRAHEDPEYNCPKGQLIWQ